MVLPDYDIDDMFGSSGGLEDVLPDSSIDPITNINDSVVKVPNDSGKLSRYTKDMSAAINHGKKLLDLCKSSRLLIMNGRLGTDKGVGHFTRVDTTGDSGRLWNYHAPIIWACSGVIYR